MGSKEAALEGLIDDPETWFQLTDDRNKTVHTYNKLIEKDLIPFLAF